MKIKKLKDLEKKGPEEIFNVMKEQFDDWLQFKPIDQISFFNFFKSVIRGDGGFVTNNTYILKNREKFLKNIKKFKIYNGKEAMKLKNHIFES